MFDMAKLRLVNGLIRMSRFLSWVGVPGERVKGIDEYVETYGDATKRMREALAIANEKLKRFDVEPHCHYYMLPYNEITSIEMYGGFKDDSALASHSQPELVDNRGGIKAFVVFNADAAATTPLDHLVWAILHEMGHDLEAALIRTNEGKQLLDLVKGGNKFASLVGLYTLIKGAAGVEYNSDKELFADMFAAMVMGEDNNSYCYRTLQQIRKHAIHMESPADKNAFGHPSHSGSLLEIMDIEDMFAIKIMMDFYEAADPRNVEIVFLEDEFRARDFITNMNVV